MERDKKWLGCQAVTPDTTTPLVKTTSMPTKPWRDLAVDLMGPLPTIKSLLVTFDYYRGWIEVDVVPSSISGRIIKCLEEDLTGYGIPETLPKYNRSNLLSHEMEKFLDELGIKHKRTIPLWLRANHCLRRYVRPMPKGKPWQRARELQKYRLAYRSTSHTTAGVGPAELLFGRRIRTEQLEFKSTEEEGDRLGTTDQQARDQDA
ncbi:uncharacterized protein K02A2.6-like [Acropora millepora]|uniref:uncharacterized protein K02A2.6-like n=1 Tax=Acropora millepora TaxID=45264 RepID=UPI001CF391FC|nr:uncharacterized protein K02A2.6-like [Acropora millepora]